MAICALGSLTAPAAELDKLQVRSFIDEMVVEHHFSDTALIEVFSQAKYAGRVVKAMSRPAEKAKPWYEYRKHFISQARINAGVKFWHQHNAALSQAEQIYGVAPEVIVGIIGVETSYGSFTGKDRVIDALATLAFHYPENRSNRQARMQFFRSQLKDFFLLAREQSVDPLSLTGSYAGAMGIPQFMPESYRKFAIDFNQDERIDIWDDPVDAIGSVANYLAKNGGWQRGKEVVLVAQIGSGDAGELVSDKVKLNRSVGELRRAGVQVFGVDDSELAALIVLEGEQQTEYWVALQNFRAIMKYNPRTKYAMAVYQLANEIYQARKNQQ
ncbi:MAG: lytic murein transglycosylase B [Gammaproteobacteria bacterium]